MSEFNRGRMAQQLHAWGYPVMDMPSDDWGNFDGYRAFYRKNGARVLEGDEFIIHRNPWLHARHYPLLLEIQIGEWPDVSNA